MNAVVTLKVTPKELQIINEALGMYAQVLSNVDRRQPMFEGMKQIDLSVHDGNAYQGLMDTNRIRKDIGLK
jgi:hypothetical protein